MSEQRNEPIVPEGNGKFPIVTVAQSLEDSPPQMADGRTTGWAQSDHFGLDPGTWNSQPAHSNQLCLHGMALPTPSMPPLSVSGEITFLLVREHSLSMQDKSSSRRLSLCVSSSLKYIYPASLLISQVIPPLKSSKARFQSYPT